MNSRHIPEKPEISLESEKLLELIDTILSNPSILKAWSYYYTDFRPTRYQYKESLIDTRKILIDRFRFELSGLQYHIKNLGPDTQIDWKNLGPHSGVLRMHEVLFEKLCIPDSFATLSDDELEDYILLQNGSRLSEKGEKLPAIARYNRPDNYTKIATAVTGVIVSILGMR